MVMNVEKISKEIIQPSSPTPQHLRTLKVSFLDQSSPIFWIPIIVFYNADHQSPNINHLERSQRLKKSLAETLTHFYPLAGTLTKDFTINCNDQGVEYFETKVSCKLSEVVEICDGKVLFQFLPFHPQVKSLDEAGSRGLLAVQYNIFDCDGVAISMCISHQIADGISAAMFLNAWAATSRGDSEAIQHPSFDGAIHFPPRENPPIQQNFNLENIVTRRFVFNKSSIDALKEQATLTDVPQVKPPTRVETVSTFIWKRFMAVARSKPVKIKVSAVLHVVNIRDRLNPPLSNSFGNILFPAVATSRIDDTEKGYGSLVSVLGNAINKINDDHVKKILNGGEPFMGSSENWEELIVKNEIQFCSFTSWVRFPLYDVNFGWGKPTWATTPSSGSSFTPNVVVLMSTRDGDGIEAWVYMMEDDMAIFETDPDLLLFVSPTVN